VSALFLPLWNGWRERHDGLSALLLAEEKLSVLLSSDIQANDNSRAQPTSVLRQL
jgi:hypothetical protein